MPATSATPKKIVVGVDGSDAGKSAVEWTARMGHQALRYLPAPGPPPEQKAAAPQPPPSYLTVNLKLQDIDLQ